MTQTKRDPEVETLALKVRESLPELHFTAFDSTLVYSIQLFKPVTSFCPSGRSNNDGNDGIFSNQKRKFVREGLQIMFKFREDM